VARDTIADHSGDRLPGTPPTPPSLPPRSSLPPVDKDGLLALYEQMLLIRRVEEMAAKAYTQRKILGFCHLYIGQESVAVGAAAACQPQDAWITGYREHGQAMAKGVSARAVMAELYGKATGSTKGLGGSMHIFDSSVNFMGGYGIVGGQVPLAVGVAWAMKQKKTDGVCFAWFGDGAAHQGAFFEAMCLAALYKLPVIFLCENNAYAMGTSIDRQSALTDMSLRGQGVGIVREQFEGFDVEHVRDRIGAAVEHARSGQGPVILEAVTYRFRGHSMSDPAKYRPAGELEEKKKSDPLAITLARLQELGATQAELDAVAARVEAAAEDAVKFAEESPIPDPAELYDYTYAPTTEG
jgi:pyruvate dehydrogenase E1 component alpha subunit